MKRCKTCKHWEAYKVEEWEAMRGAGICHAAPEIGSVTKRQKDHETSAVYLALLPEHACVLSMVVDGSGYRAELVTMPDFGCVQHVTLLP